MKTGRHSLLQRIIFLYLLYFGLSAAVFAHHSFAMFNHKGTVTLIGTVTRFQWTNPHAYLELDVHDTGGRMTHYVIEMTSINMMRRLGWKSSLMHAGDQVKVTMAALLNGKPGGLMLDVTLPNGELWETGVPAANTYVRTPEVVIGVPKT